jgi:hypothetical protein
VKAFALALALCACGPARLEAGDTLFVSDKFDEREDGAILAAIAEWNEAVPELRLEASKRRGEWLIVRQRIAVGILGRTEYIKPVIRIDAELSRERFAANAPTSHLQSTVMHEIGHALGMRGNAADLVDAHLPAGLMAPQHSGATCIDAATLRTLLEIRPELREGAHATCESETP